MIEYLAYTAPLAVFWLTITVANCACVALGFAIRPRLALEPDEKALDVAQGAIFVLASLILGFSFSFTSERFNARRLLIVEEANAIGTTYLRGSSLPASATDRFRSILRDYAQVRLATYTRDPASSEAMERKSLAMQDALWSIVVMAAREDPRNVQLALLKQTLNDTIDISTKQSAALHNHMPTAMLGLVLVVTFVAAILLGVHFERMRQPQIFLGLVFGLLFATVVTTVVDLDRPQQGLVRVDLRPLQTQLERMQ